MSDTTAYTEYLTITTRTRYEIRDITEHVERVRAAAELWDGMVLVSTMHITSSVVRERSRGPDYGATSWLGSRSSRRRD